MTNEEIKQILDHFIMKTMDGEVKWSSMDLLDIAAEIEDKKRTIRSLEFAQLNIHESNTKMAKLLALQGKTEDVIRKTLNKKFKADQLEKRLSFLYKTLKRLEAKINSFDLNSSEEWYIDIKRYPNEKFRLAVYKRLNRDGDIYYLMGIGNVTGFLEKPHPKWCSDDFPQLITLGILLGKKDRVVGITDVKYTFPKLN